MGLVVHDKDILLSPCLAPDDPLDEGGVALDPALGLHMHFREIPRAVSLLLDDDDLSRGHGGLQCRWSHIARASGGRGFRADHDRLAGLLDDARFVDLRADAPGIDSSRLEHVPVGHDDFALGEERHLVRGDEVAGAIEACFASVGVEFVQTIADCDVRTDDQDDIGESGVRAVVDFVEDAPGGEHAHHGRLARARRHLAGVAEETGVAFFFLGVARLVARDADSLAIVRAGLGQENDGLGGLFLRKEQSPIAAFALPPAEQFQSGSGHSGVAVFAPAVDALADQVD